MNTEGRPLLDPAPAIAGRWQQLHLVGFMGSGKSTVGRLLARQLLWNFLDLDALIERHAGRRITEIFAVDGEETFRTMERFVLRQAVQKPHTIVALGGGTFLDPENREVSRAHAVSVWLRCPAEVLVARLGPARHDRPLWDPATVATTLAARRQAYEEADLCVDAAAEPAQVADRVLAALADRVIPSRASRAPARDAPDE